MLSKNCHFILNYAKPAASDSLKETRDKDSSLGAALKTEIFAKPVASDYVKETRDKDPSLAVAVKTAVFNPMPAKNCHFMPNYAKPAASDSLKETRDKGSSLAAALKTAVFNPMLSKEPFYAKLCKAGRFRFSQGDPR